MTPDETVLSLTALESESVVTDGEVGEVQADAAHHSAACPDCGDTSHPVHSCYWRQPADLPIGGPPVRLHLRLKRFRCAMADCPKPTFAEPLAGFSGPRSRRSLRLAAALEAAAFALGGQAGSRLALRLRVPGSGDTLLRMLQKAPAPPDEPPRVVGVDDWAKQRGQVYGTLVVDLERRRTIELLEDRQAETLMTCGSSRACR
jgi:transposase